MQLGRSFLDHEYGDVSATPPARVQELLSSSAILSVNHVLLSQVWPSVHEQPCNAFLSPQSCAASHPLDSLQVEEPIAGGTAILLVGSCFLLIQDGHGQQLGS